MTTSRDEEAGMPHIKAADVQLNSAGEETLT